ncbi:hypothetical protein GQ600_2975 [Phytophthora cactorum]|nr:hypothetical protein GQ600_2975 [Phytophthora cactorum]
MAKARNDPYQAAFDRAGGGSIILGDQQWWMMSKVCFCDESTDRVLKETFYPVLEQFREVQIGMATFTYPKLRDEDDKDPELAIAVMLRRQSASEGALAWLDNLVSAYRQLSLSPYVQQYLGTEDISGTKQETEDVTTRHYFEFVQVSSCLKQVYLTTDACLAAALKARSLSEMLLDTACSMKHRSSSSYTLENFCSQSSTC